MSEEIVSQPKWIEKELKLWLAKRPWLGKKRSKEVREALSKAHKGKPSWNKGRKLSEQHKRMLSNAHKGKKLSLKHRKKLSNALRGSKSHFWKGGNSCREYPFEFYLMRTFVLDRDNRSCQICGTKTRRLDIHHKDQNKDNNKAENLITLCLSCHSKIHSQLNFEGGETKWK